ncbi:MAG: MarR family transcriptional regulator [Chitinophagaceae bacterium]|nr:MarR family transcriptional regulator [Chitinophagaceae bacterium]
MICQLYTYLCVMKMEDTQKLTMFRVIELHKAIYNKSNKIINKDGWGLQVEQLPVLMILYFSGASSQQDIADKLIRDKSSVLRSVVSLESKGFLVTAQDPFDKRKKMVQLSNAGRKLGDLIAAEISKLDKLLFACLDAQETEQFHALLKKCETSINEL